jgi:hypothetical protein
MIFGKKMSALAIRENFEIQSNISENIKKLLAIYELRVADLSRETKIQRLRIKKLIDKKIKYPKDNVLLPIAKHFKLSINQLKGLQPIYWENITGGLDFESGKRIPVYQLPLIENKFIQETINNIPITVLTDGNISDSSFSFIVKDSSFGFLFEPGSIVICDPEKEPENKFYVLVKFKNCKEYSLRRLFIDLDIKYTKSPNPGIPSNFRKLEAGDEIVATVSQIKLNF